MSETDGEQNKSDSLPVPKWQLHSPIPLRPNHLLKKGWHKSFILRNLLRMHSKRKRKEFGTELANAFKQIRR